MTFPWRIFAAMLLAVIPGVAAPPSDWSVVQGISAGTRVELYPADRRQPIVKGQFVRADAEAVIVTDKTGEVSVKRAAVRFVKMRAPSRRVRSGLLGVAVGAAAGIVLGAAVCPHCPNEGNHIFIPRAGAVGAAIGATAFAFTPYQTIYRAPKR